MKQKVACGICGKVEYVSPSRAKNYHCCSKQCLGKFFTLKNSKKIKCVCPICGAEFYLKPFSYKKNKVHCCSRKCLAEYKKSAFAGSGNHQFGLKGPLNSSFKSFNLIKRNGHQKDVYVYAPDCPDCNDNGRVKLHRLLIYQNKINFDNCIFQSDGKLHKKIQVHHIDCLHNNNIIDNLIPLTLKQHTKVHNLLGNAATTVISSIIGVVKQGELLETPEADDQQPSLYGNIFEGSETNGRVLLDSNADTSALLQQIYNLLNDYIVQTRNITKEAYQASIQEILESEIKSSELSTK